MKRRTAIKIVALSAVASGFDAVGANRFPSSAGMGWSASDYKLRFFTAQESELLDQLMEMIIPSDNHSPGARAAQVNLFADLMVATSSVAIQKQWREGLKQMQEEAAKSEEHTSELQSQSNLVCRLLLEKKKKKKHNRHVRRKSNR